MKVLRISRTYPNTKQRTIGLQTYMVGLNSNYHSIVFSKKSNFSILKHEKIKNYEIDYNEKNLPKKYNIFKYFFSLITKLYANYLFYNTIVKNVDFNEIKLIHVHNLNFLICGIWLKKKFNKKIFLSIGGTDILRLKNKILFQKLIKDVDKIFSVSFDLKKKFLNLYPKTKCYYISNGVELKYFKFKKNKKNNILLAVGNIRWQKNYSLLVCAMELVLKENKKFKLIIIGNLKESEEVKKITDLIKKKNLQKNIQLIGFQELKTIRSFYYKSKLLILSSISEGLPKVILESISCGTPVISTNVGDNKLILKNCGIVIKSNNPFELSNAINKIIKSEKLYTKLLNKCYKQRKKYDWRIISENIHKHY